MTEYVFGANILENLTTGMYQDSKIIYREYIQNACDQIDKAYKMRLLQAEEGRIDIWLEPESRTICIEDNATGIEASEFEKTLADIAFSNKKLGENKGFRGIGRLCGLAYCKELIFTSTAMGEDTISVMKCNAARMRELISANERGEKYTASEVLSSIYSFSTETTKEVNAHWFRVKLIGINNENNDLLDFTQIKEYLSFVAPVPYQNIFIFRPKVYEKAKQLNCTIDEYTICLNGEQIFKKYQTNYKTSKGDDEIFDLDFHEIRDSQNNLLAWLWIGISHFKAIISKECKMRGLRLRKDNIQIGSEDALQKLFNEDRGHHYFIGEVFAVSKDLIPNSQRNYFNENVPRNDFERQIRRYFNGELQNIYYEGSAINSAYSKIDSYQKKEIEISEKQLRGDYVDKQHLASARTELAKAKETADKAVADIKKKKHKAADNKNTVVSKLILRIEKEREEQAAEIPAKEKPESSQIQHQTGYRADKLSAYNKHERKLISKIYGIILSATDKKTAEMIIKKIEDNL